MAGLSVRAVLTLLGVVCLLGALFAPGVVHADGASVAATVAEIEKLQKEIDVALKAAEKLARAGKLKESLALVRTLQETTLARFEALLRELPSGAGARPSTPPKPPTKTKPKAETDAGAGPRVLERRAITNALDWLAAHQSPNGAWGASSFTTWCDGKPVADVRRRPDGHGKALYDVGVTGLALCAFLQAGYTHRGKHPYVDNVRRGLRWLLTVQDKEGCFGPRSTQQYVYNHAAAALAMVTAYGLTGASLFQRPAQKGVDFVDLARNPYFAWRYGIKPGDNDTSVSGWMYKVIAAAEHFNATTLTQPARALRYDKDAKKGMEAWLVKITDPDFGRAGYVQRGTGPARPQHLVDRYPGRLSESMTSVAVWARAQMGATVKQSIILQKGVGQLMKLRPTWNAANGSIDMYYWYYGTLATLAAGGSYWRDWRASLTHAVVNKQRQDTDACQYKGSWDPVGPWGPDGGRVYSTALMTMTLVRYYEYDAVKAR